MFGTIDLPPGGKLPPAPSYLSTNGKEISGSWIDRTVDSDPPDRHLFFPAICDTFGDVCLIQDRTAWVIRNTHWLQRDPWNHK